MNFYKDGSFYTESQIKAMYPNTSFGVPFNPKNLGFHPVFESPVPTVEWNQYFIEDGVDIDSKGNYMRRYVVKSKFEPYQTTVFEKQTVDGVETEVPVTVTVTTEEQLTKYLAELKASKLNEIATARYAEETNGVEVAGSTIKTDRESQAQISSTYTSLQNGLITTVEFKTATGWVSFDKDTFKPIAQAVANHVQDCFAKEKAAIELLELADTYEEITSIKY